MADVTITHTRAEGTFLHGSRKGDGVFDIVRNFGFWFSRSGAVDGLFIRQSRDKEAQMWRIDGAAAALRKAGHTVTVDEIKEEVRRTFAEAEADRKAQAEARADRFAERAGKAASASDARYKASHAISEYMTGEPIKVGHYSEGPHRRAIERMDGHMRSSIAESKKAGYWSDRAKTAESYKAFRENPQRTLRRMERLGADLRIQERHLAKATEKGWDGGRHARLIADLTEEIEHWQRIVDKAQADGVKLWGPSDFAPGDFARCLGSWYQVQRVNPKTLSIAWNLRLAPKQVMTLGDATDRGRVWTHTIDYTNVRARCPEVAMLAFLADGMVPGTKEAGVASEEQPASSVREDQAAKPKPKKRSDPKVPRRVFVTCPLGGGEATLTWLNGGSRPHRDFEPVKIEPPEGEEFRRAVWSPVLQAEVDRILAEHGYACVREGWQVSRDRSGFVRAIEPKPEAVPEETPAAEEAPAPELPAGGPPVADVEQPVDEAPAGGGAPVEQVTEGGEKTALNCDFSGNTRNHKDRSGVVHSVYPLTPTPQEVPAMTATTPAAKAPAKPKTPAKPKAARKAKAPKAVVPTAVATAAEVREEKPPTYGQKTVQKTVPIDRIDRDETQPREEFDQAKLEELAGSMRKLGQLQPISLRYLPATRRYVLIMGERRWRAARMAGLTEMDALVVHGVQEGARETLARQVAENVGRADMAAIEEARSFKRLVKAEYTVDEVAEMCGKSAAYVGWRIDLLKLCEPAQEALGKAILPVGMAWYVSQLSCENQLRFLSKYARGAFANDRDAQAFVQACRAEEERRQSQGSFFVLADEGGTETGDTQDALPGVHDVPEEERERIVTERTKLTKKIDRLSGAGEILSELATADPEELALLLAGTPGGLGGHQLRVEHLRALTVKVIANLRKAQAIAGVRAGAIEINPEAAA